jgi:uncharacterized protein YjiS (DUF1127 family)
MNMATLLLNSSIRPGARSERSYLTRASGLLKAAARAWSLRQASHKVEGLSDEMLHDIGISRGEIDIAVRYGRRGLTGTGW